MNIIFLSYIFLIWLVRIKIINGEINKNVKNGCGSTKGCVFKPADCQPFTDCIYFMSYTPANNGSDTVILEILGQISGKENQYVAVGLSDDAKMGDDSVTYCMLNDTNNKPTAGIAYNNGKSNQIITDETLTKNVQLIDGGVIDSTLLCRISQTINPQTNDNRLRSLNKPYNILIATGGANPQVPRLSIHKTDPADPKFPFISGSQLNLNQPISSSLGSSGGASQPPSEAQPCINPKTMSILIKAHGILMIFGWWFFVATAILFARYFRSLWSDQKFMGTLIWFNLHRGLNFIGVLSIIVALICVYTAACWTWVGGDFPKHVIPGVIASICAFIQPFLAFVRCHPGTSKRPIFNWVHRFIGIGGFCCACYTIFSATDFRAGLHYDRWGSGPMGMIIFYYVAIVIVVIALELMITLAERIKRQKVANEIPLSSSKSVETTEGVGIMKFHIWNYARLILIGIFIIIAIAVAITLACFIGWN